MFEAITHMRPDQQAVYEEWAGSPNKPAAPNPAMTLQLQPRSQWRRIVRRLTLETYD